MFQKQQDESKLIILYYNAVINKNKKLHSAFHSIFIFFYLFRATEVIEHCKKQQQCASIMIRNVSVFSLRVALASD